MSGKKGSKRDAVPATPLTGGVEKESKRKKTYKEQQRKRRFEHRRLTDFRGIRHKYMHRTRAYALIRGRGVKLDKKQEGDIVVRPAARLLLHDLAMHDMLRVGRGMVKAIPKDGQQLGKQTALTTLEVYKTAGLLPASMTCPPPFDRPEKKNPKKKKASGKKTKKTAE
jgi:hypothetical protein